MHNRIFIEYGLLLHALQKEKSGFLSEAAEDTVFF